MKYAILSGALIAFALGSCGESEPTGELPKTQEDSFSYAVGVNIGQSLKTKGLDKISISGFVKGLRDGMALDSNFALTEDQMARIQPDYIASVQAGKMKEIQAVTKAKLAEIAKKKGVSALPSNAYYEEVEAGSGKTPQPFDTIVCRFLMKDAAGNVLIDNMSNEQPFRGELAGLRLAPLEEAFQKASAKGKFNLYISNELHPRLVDPQGDFKNRYGISIFEVTLLDVIPGVAKKD
jgi:FKBP-type peptidyl-prolyl cis-trans isomerase FklB